MVRLIVSLYILFLIFLVPLWVRGTYIWVHIAETTKVEDYKLYLKKASKLWIKVIRVPVDWYALEPEKGMYDKKYIDEIKQRVAYAQKLGQKVIIMISQSPEWASWKTWENAPAYPPRPKYYKDFANAISYLYENLLNSGDAYDINSNTILAWEIWNEPNVLEFWRPDSSIPRVWTEVLIPLDAAQEYANMLAVTYKILKSKHEDMIILWGSLASADVDYLNELYKYWWWSVPFDHLSIHPYAWPDNSNPETNSNYGRAQFPDQCNEDDPLTPPWCFEEWIRNVRNFLDSKWDKDVEIRLTEFWTSSDDERGGAGNEEMQKEHMKIAINILKKWSKNQDMMKIPVAIVYRLKDENDDFFWLYNSDLTIKPVGLYLRSQLDEYWKIKYSSAPYISKDLKVKLDKLVSRFVAKLDKRYSDSQQKVKVLGKVIEKLKFLKNKSVKFKRAIEYVIEELERRKNFYVNSRF